ncbi:GNAT family N-acetyltransferase [Leucobacter albus]|uniref:GNAT family N-acetyltransferase n=1 Tax=Leucobacter albus TaxID=272210 RepID=A0ABW3TNS9_9MICO
MLQQSQLPLTNNHARLRALHFDDAAPYAAGTADPAVREFGHLPEPEYTPASVRAMIERDAAPGLERGDLAVLAIANAADDAFVGSLVIFDVRADSAEVGFWLHPSARGRGFASSALALAAEFAQRSGLSTVTARTAADNAASQRTLESAGFRAGTTETATAPSGKRIDIVHYELPLS